MSEPNITDLLSGGGFSSLLQNPDIAAKLPRILEALQPVMAEMRAEQNGGSAPSAAKPEETAPDAAAPDAAAPTAASPDLSALLGAGNKGSSQRKSSARRCALLKALEPYLSENRREALEYIIKVSTLIDILSEVM